MGDYEESRKQGKIDCERAMLLLNADERWEKGLDHNPMSVRIFRFLQEYDYRVCRDSFCWKAGGDGDNGEQLMYELDAFFETLEKNITVLPDQVDIPPEFRNVIEKRFWDLLDYRKEDKL